MAGNVTLVNQVITDLWGDPNFAVRSSFDPSDTTTVPVRVALFGSPQDVTFSQDALWMGTPVLTTRNSFSYHFDQIWVQNGSAESTSGVLKQIWDLRQQVVQTNKQLVDAGNAAGTAPGVIVQQAATATAPLQAQIVQLQNKARALYVVGNMASHNGSAAQQQYDAIQSGNYTPPPGGNSMTDTGEVRPQIGSITNSASDAAQQTMQMGQSATLAPTGGALFGAVSAAQANLAPDAAKAITDACGPLAALAGAGQVANAVQSQIHLFEKNGVRCMDAINASYKPNDVNSPNRCNDISDYTGSVTGKHTSSLASITQGLQDVVGALSKVSNAVLAPVQEAAQALQKAIATGSSELIGAATHAMGTVMGPLNTALGGATLNSATSAAAAVGKVADAVTKEQTLMQDALAQTGNFNVLLPNVSPCLVSAAERQTNTAVNSNGNVISNVLSAVGGGIGGVINSVQGAITGYGSSGLPTTNTLNTLSDQANTNASSGAAGI
jgi:hypothetical protein